MNNLNEIFEGLCFVTITVVDWVDIFNRPKYKHIILNSLEHCQRQKGLVIHGWVLMSNHLHMIASTAGNDSIANIIRDFKKFTSKKIFMELKDDIQESRRKWMLARFCYAAQYDQKLTNFRFWQDGYHPETICSYDFFLQKLNYIHNNPVRQEIVSLPDEYLYSSATDYCGNKGLLNINVIV